MITYVWESWFPLPWLPFSVPTQRVARTLRINIAVLLVLLIVPPSQHEVLSGPRWSEGLLCLLGVGLDLNDSCLFLCPLSFVGCGRQPSTCSAVLLRLALFLGASVGQCLWPLLLSLGLLWSVLSCLLAAYLPCPSQFGPLRHLSVLLLLSPSLHEVLSAPWWLDGLPCHLAVVLRWSLSLN